MRHLCRIEGKALLDLEALRYLGAWPSHDLDDALVALLARQIANADDPEKKSKLKALQSSSLWYRKAEVVSR
jgi:hypothetical protein